MRMEKINSGTIKVTITNQELDERGIDLLSLLGDEDGIESFLYSILDEIDVDDEFKSTGAVSFQVLPNSTGLDMFIKNKNVFDNQNQINNNDDEQVEDDNVDDEIEDDENDNETYDGAGSEMFTDTGEDRTDEQRAQLPSMGHFKDYTDTKSLYSLIRAKEMLGKILDFKSEDYKYDDKTKEFIDNIQLNLSTMIDALERSDDYAHYKLMMIATINQARSERQDLDSTSKRSNSDPFKDMVKNVKQPSLGHFNPQLEKWEMILKVSDFDNVVKLADAIHGIQDVDSILYKVGSFYVVQLTTTRTENEVDFKHFTSAVSEAVEYGNQINAVDFKHYNDKKVIMDHSAMTQVNKYFG
ncbi:adaptor protein MecA [Apilactobacillus kunkeei]|uniref:adaptor protein MecA n=1 Tax=Apilactobacillus kunkeei TaxID=148814 RepID=UPI002657C3AF|nr:adaptor protein MecA [Apilactobacillus kunkeei]WJV42961.1 adaptor protein MecA [Apilactobacillus kunkeei]